MEKNIFFGALTLLFLSFIWVIVSVITFQYKVRKAEAVHGAFIRSVLVQVTIASVLLGLSLLVAIYSPFVTIENGKILAPGISPEVQVYVNMSFWACPALNIFLFLMPVIIEIYRLKNKYTQDGN